MLLLVVALVLAIIFSFTTYGLSLVAWIILLSIIIKKETSCYQPAIPSDKDSLEDRKDLVLEMFDDQRNKFGVKTYPSWCKSVQEFTDPNSKIYKDFYSYLASKRYQECNNISANQFHKAILKDASNFLLLTACAELQGFKDIKEQWDLALDAYYHMLVDRN